MSALLDEIIEAASDSKQPLSDVLRKCLRLGHELKNEQLKTWATQELDGYRNGTDLPAYRIVRGDAFGYFSGPFGAQARNYPIPSLTLEKKHREFAEQVYFAQPVSAYEDVLEQQDVGLRFPWPPNLVAYYQNRLGQGQFALLSAWQDVPKNVVVAMLDAVRNRTLKMALEIKDELGTSYRDLHKVKPTEAARIQNIIFQNTGGTTNVAFDRATVDASIHDNVIAVGDRKALDAALSKVGLEKSDLDELTDAISSKGEETFGTKAKNWIKDKAPKVAVAGMRIGTEIGREILTKMLMQYYGLTG